MGGISMVKSWTFGPGWGPLVIQALLAVFAAGNTNFTEFKFTVEPSDLVAVRGKKAVLNCSAHHGSDNPTIQWIRDDVYMKTDADVRRNILPNGSLEFREVVHSRAHRPDEGVYQCVASVEKLGTLVSRKAKLQVAHLAKSFRAEPQNLVVHLGDNAMFSCDIEGQPKPDIVWYRDEQEITESATRRIHQDGVLEINNVQFSDLGNYKCKAENAERARTSRIAELAQNSDASSYEGASPTFIMKPQNKVALEGSTVMLYCGSNGRDRNRELPKITWLKGGSTIDLKAQGGRFSTVGQGSLQINSVQEQDVGVYTCRTTNMEDSVDADAHLTVHMLPFFRQRPRSTVANQNEDILFECDVYGIPKPIITWWKNGERVIPSDYFQIVDGRNLKILGLVESDEGVYQCFGENAVGSIQASSQLVIHKQEPSLPTHLKPSTTPTHIGDPATGTSQASESELPTEPTVLQSIIVSTRFVTLSWKPPNQDGMSLVTMYSVYWSEQGSDRERVTNTSRTEANIQNLKPATSYVFRVVAYNSKGASKRAAHITVKTQQEVNVPGAPTSLMVVPLSPTSIKLQWEPPHRTNGHITSYKVHYYEVGANKEQNVDVNGQTYTLDGLKKFTEYSFRVVAYNSEGAGTSTDEVMIKTLSDAPSAPPQNFSLETGSSTSIIVRWEPPPTEQQNGIITGYKIRYKLQGQRGETATTDGNRRTYALSGLQRGKTYSIRVQALNVNGSSPATAWITAATLRHDLDETQVPGKPTALTVRPRDTSIIVSWTPPREQDIMIRGYYLGYGKGIPDEYTMILSDKTRYYEITDLKPSTQYVISLRASNSQGQGIPILETVRTKEATTPEPMTPMIPPVGLKAIVLSSSTIVVTWTDSTLGTRQQVTDSRYYTVKYFSRTASHRQKHINTTDLNVHIDRLKADTEYEFSVKVTKSRRQSAYSLSVVNRTFEAAPESPPKDVTPVSVPNRPTSVMINWQPPRQPNGQITGYLVYYTTDPSQDDRSWVVQPVLGAKLSQIVNKLSLDTVYYFKVQARNSKGYGPYSKIKAFRTPSKDGTGGGIVDTRTPGRDPPYVINSDNDMTGAGRSGKSGRNGGNKRNPGGTSTNMLVIIIASLAAVLLIAIVVVTVILCKRRIDGRERRNKKGYKPANKGTKPGPKDLKPPDLWIHHDQMEMKRIDKTNRSESNTSMSPTHHGSQDVKSTDGSSVDIEKRRNSFINEHHRFEPVEDDRYRRPLRAKPIMIPVDAQPPPPREPIATVTAMPNGGMLGSEPSIPTVRPIYPRTQYTAQYASTPRVNAADLSQPSSVRPQQPPSPHKKPTSQPSSTPSKARPPMPVITPKAPDVTIRGNPDECELPKSCSTEELSAEMANLEGLMKDLNAITQQEFEC